jgi:nucleoside-diphosphate-sugar epimerase
MYPPFAGGSLPPQYRTAGYPFRDLGVHALYLLEAFLGEIEDVKAQWSSLGGDPNLAYDEWRAQVQCAGGTGQVHLSWNVRPLQSQLIIQGTRGVMRVDLFLMFGSKRGVTPLPKPVERLINAATDSVKPLTDTARGVIGFLRGKVLPYHGLQALVAEFYRSLAAGDAPPVSAASSVRVVKWVEQIARAADEEHLSRLKELTVSERVPVLVTGASGSLGRAIVQRFRNEGVSVRTLVRRVPDQMESGVEVVIGDLGDPDAVDRAVRGAEKVIHAGAAMKGGWTEHECGTVIGTRNVLDACRKYAVEKLVHISSMSVIDWACSRRSEISESTPFEPRAEARGHYTRAKLAAEQLVTGYTKSHHLPTVILRPGQIFGGGIPVLTPAVARKLGSRWLVLGNGRVRLALVHMNDVVQAIFLAMNGPLRRGEIIQLVGDETPTQNEVLAEVGRSAPILRIPRPVVFALGKLSEPVFALLKRTSPVSTYRLRSALAIQNFRSGNAATLLGWSSRIGWRDGQHPPTVKRSDATENDIPTQDLEQTFAVSTG